IEKMVNAGIYVLNPDVIRHIPAEYYPITEVANSLLRSGRRVGAFDLLNEWIDIGHHDQLRRARQGY
ncbi:MAG TPA: sugar phosphate nucleotidyltransferase, partial [Kiritimatiellia bacterium]|nr:sugar phosphate nucleotidyltransferase [Kiritimatiellia bacterium]